MKNPMLVISFVLLFSTCKRDIKVCHNPVEISVYNHEVDISSLSSIPALYDTLTKYQLQVWRIVEDNILFGFKSQVYYKGLMVIDESYYLYRYKKDNSLLAIGQPEPESVDISLSPSLTYKQALGIASKRMDFSNTCLSYRLAIFDITIGDPSAPVDHKLVWQVMGDKGWPNVILDAHTGEVYRTDDGIRY